MESCGGSNYWARSIESLGHQTQLIAPQYVKPFVQRNKTDWKDAEAICVAARQPHMRFVPRKSVVKMLALLLLIGFPVNPPNSLYQLSFRL